jgi:hypothetical protein
MFRKSTSGGSAIISRLTLATVLISAVNAHSFLIEPKADYRTNDKPECRVGGPPQSRDDSCNGPCIAENSKFYNKNAPTTTWQRGQTVTVVWTKNNHHDGFVRVSLVPVNKRMDKDAHEKMAFRYACWDTGMHDCPSNSFCGTQNKLYRAYIQIPDVYPDGLYVMGWSWFGGTESGRAEYGDYYSCASIEIKGGTPIARSYKPIWHSSTGKSTCTSGVNKLGICWREPCDPDGSRQLHQAEMLPAQFSNNRTPPAIESSWFEGLPLSGLVLNPHVSVSAPSSVYGKGEVRVVAFEFIDVSHQQVFCADLSKPVYLNGRLLNIRAVTTGAVRFVNFFINGNIFRTTTRLPFSVGEGAGGRFNRWDNFPKSTWFELRALAIGHDGTSATLAVPMNLVP